jgi:hypothetical protein
MRWLLAAAALAAVVPTSYGVRPARATTPQHVTVIGDSVAGSLYWDSAEAILSQGVDLDLQAAACRRIEDESCDIGGGPPSNVLQLLGELRAGLGPTVVMILGYNEFAADWTASVNDLLAAFEARGVNRVLWLTLREAQHPYIDMNDELSEAAAAHPDVTVLDWNAYSRDHPDWFQSDGIHLLPSGSIAMATFVHSALADAGIAAPPPASAAAAQTAGTLEVVTDRLPTAAGGSPYTFFLAARGGTRPYRWSRAGPFPPGIVLASDGLIAGIPRARPRSIVLAVRVVDARGKRSTRRLTLQVVR